MFDWFVLHWDSLIKPPPQTVGRLVWIEGSLSTISRSEFKYHIGVRGHPRTPKPPSTKLSLSLFLSFFLWPSQDFLPVAQWKVTIIHRLLRQVAWFGLIHSQNGDVGLQEYRGCGQGRLTFSYHLRSDISSFGCICIQMTRHFTLPFSSVIHVLSIPTVILCRPSNKGQSNLERAWFWTKGRDWWIQTKFNSPDLLWLFLCIPLHIIMTPSYGGGAYIVIAFSVRPCVRARHLVRAITLLIFNLFWWNFVCTCI